MKPSPFKTVTDAVHLRIATATGQAWRAEEPFYAYGHEDFDGDEGEYPRVRYREEGTYRLFRDESGRRLFEQVVLMQLWTEDVDSHIDEVWRLIEAHEAEGMVAMVDDEGIVGEWAYDEDGKPITEAGFMSVVPLLMYATPDTSTESALSVVLQNIHSRIERHTDTNPLTDDGELITTVDTPGSI